MLSLLTKTEKTVGVKQTTRAILAGRAEAVYVAWDAEERLTDPVRALCRERGIPVFEVQTMHRLGQACGIAVGAAVAAALKSAE